MFGQIAGSIIGGMFANKAAKRQAEAMDRANQMRMMPYTDMQPYLSAAFERAKRVTPRNGAQPLDPATGKASETTRVDALPARSDASWGMVMHPALMDVCDAMIGCQVGEMSQAEMQRRMQDRAKQVPWQMHLSQIIRVEPDCGAQACWPGWHRS